MNWIETRSKMPPETTAIIMWIPEEDDWTMGYVYSGHFYRTGSNKPLKEEVTYWFIPEPPKS